MHDVVACTKVSCAQLTESECPRGYKTARPDSPTCPGTIRGYVSNSRHRRAPIRRSLFVWLAARRRREPRARDGYLRARVPGQASRRRNRVRRCPAFRQLWTDIRICGRGFGRTRPGDRKIGLIAGGNLKTPAMFLGTRPGSLVRIHARGALGVGGAGHRGASGF
jgi:hypothetical protein